MANKRKALGKGLSALIPEELEKEENNTIQEIDINLICPNPNQPRQVFEQEKIDELAASIKKYGVIQPIIVKKDNGIYNIIAGERRWRASKEAGLSTIPCIIRDIENKNASEIALIENIQREDLNPVDEAKAYEFIMQHYAITQEQVAEIVGKSRVYVTNIMRLLTLSDYVLDKIVENKISAGHARAIISLDEKLQREVTDRIIKDNLSVRDVEKIVRDLKKIRVKRVVKKDKFIQNIEDLITSRLSVKVNIKHNKNKGKIELEYSSLSELDRILALMQITDDEI